MSLELFVEHLTGKPGPANEALFNYLASTLPPRRQEVVVLHFFTLPALQGCRRADGCDGHPRHATGRDGCA